MAADVADFGPGGYGFAKPTTKNRHHPINLQGDIRSWAVIRTHFPYLIEPYDKYIDIR